MVDQTAKGIVGLTPPPIGEAGVMASPSQSLWLNVWRRFLRHRLALAGMLVLIFLALGTLLGPPGV